MMNNNKILTVSYGTFSCTLEGFDDSFGTMKAIAEYFRDLAADDRYFGAEPPQPDADMLARIAQKEISRRVEAREHEGRIVLSAQNDARMEVATSVSALDAQEAAGPVPTPQPEAAQPPQQPAENTETLKAEDVAQSTDEAAAPAPEAFVPPAAEPEVTAEIEAPEESDHAADSEAAPEDAAPLEVAASRAEISADDSDTESAEPEQMRSEVVADDLVEEDVPEETIESFFASSAAPAESHHEDEAMAEEVAAVEADMPEAEDMPFAASAVPDSIAEKLRRIRAVVSQSDDAPVEDAIYDEEDGAEVQASDSFISDFMSGQDTDDAEDKPSQDGESAIAEAAADIEQALQADDAVYAQDDEDDFGAEEYSAPDLTDAAVDNSADTPQTASKAEDEAINLTGFEFADDAEEIAAIDEQTDLTAAVSEEDETDVEDVLDNLFGASKQDTSTEDDTDALVSSFVSDGTLPAAAPSARLMKVKHADLEAALEQDDTLEDEDPTSLAEDIATDQTHQDTQEKSSARSSLPVLEDDQDTDVSRLMAEADTQMKEPESAGRRKAFAHLRAAVAAKKADRAMGAKDAPEVGDQAYRSDLADAVKPRRPSVGSATRTERPISDTSAAPLKLVAEQRVDMKMPAGPVTPRRIAAAHDPMISGAAADSFAAFADEVGATKLPDLLEAAAAYMRFVEGHDQFSRPQLMTKVRQVENEEFSREDSLRSFGQLLRAGKIQKIKGGRFTVSDDIGFKPDERAVG